MQNSAVDAKLTPLVPSSITPQCNAPMLSHPQQINPTPKQCIKHHITSNKRSYHRLPAPLALPPVPFLIRIPLFTTPFPFGTGPTLSSTLSDATLPFRLLCFCTFRCPILVTLALLLSGLMPSPTPEVGLSSIGYGRLEGCCSSMSMARCAALLAEHCSLVSAARFLRVREKSVFIDCEGADVGVGGSDETSMSK